jgi:hypothetical protein
MQNIEEFICEYGRMLFDQGKYDELLLFVGYLAKCVRKTEVEMFYHQEMKQLGYID